jgi:hypothetical protein
MSPLRNPRYEAAAQHLAAGKAGEGRTLQEEAAELGGLDPAGKSFKANARKLCRRKDIQARVAEIQLAGAHLAAISTGSLLLDATTVFDGAVKDREWSAANSCIQTKAKLAGLWKDKTELTGKDGAPVGQVRFVVETVTEGDKLAEVVLREQGADDR